MYLCTYDQSLSAPACLIVSLFSFLMCLILSKSIKQSSHYPEPTWYVSKWKQKKIQRFSRITPFLGKVFTKDRFPNTCTVREAPFWKVVRWNGRCPHSVIGHRGALLSDPIYPTYYLFYCFYRTRVRSLGMLVTHSLSASLTNCCLVNLTLSTLVKILKLKHRRDFEAEVWSVFCCCCLVEVTKLNLGQYSEARFGQDFNFRFSRDADVWLWFWS